MSYALPDPPHQLELALLRAACAELEAALAEVVAERQALATQLVAVGAVSSAIHSALFDALEGRGAAPNSAAGAAPKSAGNPAPNSANVAAPNSAEGAAPKSAQLDTSKPAEGNAPRTAPVDRDHPHFEDGAAPNSGRATMLNGAAGAAPLRTKRASPNSVDGAARTERVVPNSAVVHAPVLPKSAASAWAEEEDTSAPPERERRRRRAPAIEDAATEKHAQERLRLVCRGF